MKRIYYIMLALVLLFGISGCGEKRQVEEDLTCTLDFLIRGNEEKESYLYSVDIMDSGLEVKGIFKYVANKVTYKISTIETDKDKATVLIQFTTPDVEQILSNIPVEIEDELLEEKVKEHLESEFPIKEYEVTLDLKKIEEHWYLVPSAELNNVMTGGMVEWYSEMGLRVVEKLIGGMEDE